MQTIWSIRDDFTFSYEARAATISRPGANCSGTGTMVTAAADAWG